MKKDICFVVSTFVTAQAFLKDHIAELSKEFNVYLVANFTPEDYEKVQQLQLTGYHHADINRKIAIKEDSKALLQLIKYFREKKFYAVHSVTPKAGLLSALAAKISGIKNRIHIFTGQVWVTKEGVFRTFLKSLDRLIASLCTHVLVDGNAQREFLLAEGVVKKNAKVLGLGSISGVDTVRFQPNSEIREKIRKEIGVTPEKTVFMFLGRMNTDKGINELISSFQKLVIQNPDAFLLMVGYDEENFEAKFKTFPIFNDKLNYHFYGSTTKPEDLLNAGDVFCLPSYREGFGSSVIEASSVGLAVIASDAYGLRDAYEKDVTGLQCKVKDVKTLYLCMEKLMYDKLLRKELGENGRKRVKKYFDKELVCQEWLNFYKNL